MIRLVVCDLDATLANTADLPEGRHVPGQALQRVPIGKEPTALMFDRAVCDLLGNIIARGYLTAVITRAPAPYASTVIALLGIDTCGIIAAGQQARTVEDKLRKVSSRLGIPPEHMLYMGDRQKDKTAADKVGCAYLKPPWLDGGSADDVLRMLPPVHVRLLPMSGSTRLHGSGPGVIDLAIQRLIAGKAKDSDYQMLEERRYVSWLRAYGDPQRVRDSDIRDAMEAEDLVPWALLTDEDIRDLIETGDVGRLLDVSVATVVKKLDGNRKDNALLEAALQREVDAGARVTVRQALLDLPPLARNAITAQPTVRPRLLDEIASSLREERVLDHDLVERLKSANELDARQKAGIAAMVLRTIPAQKRRRQLQLLVLAGLTQENRFCLMEISLAEGRAGISPLILTRRERDADASLSAATAAALARAFPLRSTGMQGGNVKGWGLVPYAEPIGSQLLWRLKNWDGTQSGPEVSLGLLELPALAMAGHVRAMPGVAVVPVPASPFSSKQPGQVSERLAARIAEIAVRPYVPALSKSGWGSITCGVEGNGCHVVVVDDQTTTGTTMTRCIEALRAKGFCVDAALTWGSTQLIRSGTSASETCIAAWAAAELGVQCPCFDAAHAPSPDIAAATVPVTHCEIVPVTQEQVENLRQHANLYSMTLELTRPGVTTYPYELEAVLNKARSVDANVIVATVLELIGHLYEVEAHNLRGMPGMEQSAYRTAFLAAVRSYRAALQAAHIGDANELFSAATAIIRGPGSPDAAVHRALVLAEQLPSVLVRAAIQRDLIGSELRRMTQRDNRTLNSSFPPLPGEN